MSDLSRIDIKFLSGVGPKRAEMLAKQLDIHSFRDLLYYFPFRYIDRSSIYKIANLKGDMTFIQLADVCTRYLTMVQELLRWCGLIA